MAMKWSDVAASSAFQALNPDEQEEARQQYFNDVVASQVPEEDLSFARRQFDDDTIGSIRAAQRAPVERSSIPLPQDPRIAGALQPDDPSLERAIVRLPGNIARSAGAQLKGAVAGGRRVLADIQAGMDVAKAESYRKYQTDDPRVKAQQERGAQEAEERAGQAELEQGRAQRTTRRAAAEAAAAVPTDAGPVERAVQSGASSALVTIPIVTAGALVPGGQAPALAALGGLTGTQRYGELRAAGLDEGSAALSAGALGGLEALTEAIPLGTLAKKSPFMHKAMEFLVQDLLGENVSSLAQLADDYRLQLRDDVTIDDIKQTIGETTAATVVGAGAQLTVSGLMENVIDMANRRAADRATRAGMAQPQINVDEPTLDVEQQSGVTNHTPPDSLSARVGLTPIVVPNVSPDKNAEVAKEFGFDQLEEAPNVGLPDGVGAVPAAGGAGAGADVAGGVAVAGPDSLGARAGSGATVAPGAAGSQAGAVSDAAGQQATPVKTWMGRSGTGYVTEGDAQQALPGRQKQNPDLAWKIEKMDGGKFRLAAYPAALDTAAHDAATSPTNDLPEPTDAQKEAGNYKKGHLRVQGLDISVENPQGSVRRSKADAKEPWEVTMPAHYGYIRGTEGADGDHIDITLGSQPGNEALPVFVFDQTNQAGKFDEHKVFIGFANEDEARSTYRASFAGEFGQKMESSLIGVRKFTPGAFKEWLQNGDHSQPATGETSVTETAQAFETETQGSQAARAASVAAPSAVASTTEGVSGLELEGLKLAPNAPTSVLNTVDTVLRRRDGVEIQQVPQKDMSPGARVASALARMFNKTLTVVRPIKGDPKELPMGMLNRMGGKHILIAENSEDAPLFVAVHEIYHTLPDEQRTKLNAALMELTKEEKHADFAERYGYHADDISEELPAMMAQAISKRASFWGDLREKMGDKDFADVARIIIDKLAEMLKGIKKSYGEAFLKKYVKDVQRAHDLLTEAYAQALSGKTPAKSGVDLVAARREQIGDFEAGVEKDGSLTIAGDIDAVRELLPEGVVGRTTNAGLRITNADAPRVRAALAGRNVAYGRAGEVTERLPMRDGKYLGAPEKFNTPGKIPSLRKWLKQLALEGKSGRMWYERSSEEVLRMVGGSVHEARKFAALLAIYSPQAKVDTNATFALRAWAQHKAGQPINVKTKVMDQKATEAMADVDAFWSGEKTGNFVTNLLRKIDPSLAQGATIDMWMMRAAQYANDAPGATQYSFMENEVNRLAKELKWEPQQVQAAIWVAMKARMENKGVKQRTEAKSEKRGWITFEMRDGKKVRKILSKEAHRNNWLETAFAHTPAKQDTDAAKFDFGDGLRRHIGQVSFEARPGRSSGVLPGVHDAPYSTQVSFQQDVQKALYDRDGIDLLAQKLGLLVEGEVIAPGLWMGEVSPSTQKSIAMAPDRGGTAEVDPAQRKSLDAYAAVLGLLTRQEGVGWHRPFYTRKVTEHNGLDIDIGRSLNPTEATDLEKAVGEWMRANGKPATWWEQFAFISSPKGIRIVNFGAVSNDELRKQIIDVAAQVLPDGSVTSFKSDGGMPTNDWQENPNGQAYVQGIRSAGRSDVLDWARDILAPRVQDVFERYSREQGWGDPGKLVFANRVAAGAGEEELSESEGVRGSAGSVAGDRRPYSEPGKRGVKLEGLPDEVEVDGQVLEFTGFKPAQDAARSYMQRAGLPYSPPRTYANIDLKRARRIAEEFTLLIHDPAKPEVKLAYQMMIKETLAQYREILGTGLQVEFIRGDDPYGNPRKALLDVVENNHLWVFPTSAGFGSDAKFDASQNPLLAETEFKISGETALANDIFRVVHDYFGHVKDGVGFRAEGEENAWRSHSAMYSPIARRAMTSETRGQNSWVNFGPHGEKNRFASAYDTVYADQKIGLLPKWVSEEGAADEPVFSNRERGPVFYSSLTRAAEQLKLTKASEAQWLATLKNQPGVKEEEIQWTGLHDWLMSLGRQATKDEVVEFLRANELQIDEVLKGGQIRFDSSPSEQARRYNDLVVELSAKGYTPEFDNDIDNGAKVVQYLIDRKGNRFEWMPTPGPDGPALPHGLDDRWLGDDLGEDGELIKLPIEIARMANELDILGQRIAEQKEDGNKGGTRYAKYTTPGGERYRELLLTLPRRNVKIWEVFNTNTGAVLATFDTEAEASADADRRGGNVDYGRHGDENDTNQYRSSHWDEPNILAHVRFDERTDQEGKRVLFIQEIQSDWHQQGRKRGYRNSDRVATRAMHNDDGYWSVEDQSGQFITNIPDYDMTDSSSEAEAVSRGRDRLLYRPSSTSFDSRVPDAPLKTSWQEFVFKRMLRWAAENNFDRIAWTTGEMQAERYDLSRHVQVVEVVWHTHDPDDVEVGEYLVNAWDKNEDRVLKETANNEEEVADLIGKELAEKATKRINKNGRTRDDRTVFFEGLDLKVGGEGMKGFYDDILPKFVNKYTKKWGGRVSSTHLKPSGESRLLANDSAEEAAALGAAPVHSVDITMPMRDAALSGQPVFSNRVRDEEPKQAETSVFKRWFGDSKVVDENGEPLVVYHGTSAKSDFEKFRPMKKGREIGFHFGSAAAANDRLTLNRAARKQAIVGDVAVGSRIMPMYLRIENPIRFDEDPRNFTIHRLITSHTVDPKDGSASFRPGPLLRAGALTQDEASELDKLTDDPDDYYETRARERLIEILESKGYDGIIYPNSFEDEGSDSYVVFHPEQIKSAIGNDGAFDPDSPSIIASNRSRRPLLLERDKLGNIRFAAGARAYRIVADVANAVLDKLKLKPVSSELGRAMRRMRADIAAAKEKAANVAGKLGTLSPEEREMISDVIERELRAGVTPTDKILAIAANMQHVMSEQTKQLVDLGMISDEAANRWDGKYLPRFYQKQFKDELKAWARAARQLFGKKGVMQGIGGNSLKARGLFKDIKVEELPAYEQSGWEVRDPGFDPAESSEVTIWRDFTKQERSDMNEIRDSMFRFVMGYMRAQKDIALGRLYRHISRTMASRSPKDGYVQVPDTSVEGTTAKRYGELAGKWVPQEVMDHLSAADNTDMNELFKLYLKGLSAWKEGRTVLNPVSHVNNVVSNVTMAHMAGVSYWDVHKYVGAVRDLVKKDGMVQEAKEAGLFGGTFNQADLLNNMPEQLKVMAGMSESAVSKAAGHVWNAMSFWLRKPLQKAYEGEDLFFRYLIYRDARKHGMDPDAAVEYAQEYIFTYDDLPKGARAIRDTVVPFFSWTYKAIPALARTALEYPWRFAAPAAALWGANTAMYAIAGAGEGDEDEPWWEVVLRFVRDPAFRAAVHELEADERKDLPPWNKGTTAIGTPKVVRMGQDDVTDLPMFLDVSRLMPGGDMFDAENNAGGIPWFAPIDPGGPAVSVLFGMFGNLDYFTGKNIVSEADTDVEAAEKRASWMYQALAPAIAPFGYHFNRAMNALAYATDTTIDLGPVEYTGFGKDGLPVQPSLAALQTFGIKLRPVDLDQSRAIQDSQREHLVRDLNTEINRLKRLRGNGAISDDAYEEQVLRAREKKARLKQGLTVEGDEED